MESNSQDEKVQEARVQKLEEKLKELRQQRLKVDEANDILRKKLETLTANLDSLDAKYGKNGTEIIANGKSQLMNQSESEEQVKDGDIEIPVLPESNSSDTSAS